MKEISYRTEMVRIVSSCPQRFGAIVASSERDCERGVQGKPERINNNTKWALGQRKGLETLTSMQCRSCRTIAGCREGNRFQFDVAKLESLDIGLRHARYMFSQPEFEIVDKSTCARALLQMQDRKKSTLGREE